MARHLLAVTLAIACAAGASVAQDAPNPDIVYRLWPDSLEQGGVPKGEMRGPFTLASQAYPGTQHTYWVPVSTDPRAAVERALRAPAARS